MTHLIKNLVPKVKLIRFVKLKLDWAGNLLGGMTNIEDLKVSEIC